MLTPYFAIFIFLSCMVYPYGRVSKYHQDSIKLVCFLVFTLFFGLHGNVGDDYEAYKTFYEELSMACGLVTEPGFIIFAWCFKILHLPFWCFILGCSTLINGLLFTFLWHRKENVPFVLCIFLAMSGIMLEINFVRSTISLMLFANSITFLRSKNARRFILLNAIGILFHYSSIVYLLSYFFLGRKYTRKGVAIIILCGFGLASFHFPWLAPVAMIIDMLNYETLSQISSYYLSTDMYLGFSLGTVERLLTTIAVLYYYERLTTNAKDIIAVNSFLLYVLFYSLLSAYAMLGIRMSNMFVLGYWLLWPLILKCIEQKSVKISVSVLMLAYMTVRIVGLSNLPQWQYKTILLTN